MECQIATCNDVRMTPRIATATGCVLAVLGGSGLLAYMAGLGLDRADQLASVISMFVALTGLLLAGYGIVLARRTAQPPPPPPRPGEAAAPGIHNEISGTVNGPVVMGSGFSVTMPAAHPQDEPRREQA